MVYIAVFLILAYLSYCEFKGKKYKYLSLEVLVCFLTLFAVIRYGQGTDYFAYVSIYNDTPTLTRVANLSGIFTFNAEVESGFLFLSAIFRTLNLGFPVFAGFIAIITMFLIYKFIKNNSELPITALTIFYVFYYLVYVLSGIRQGLAIGIFVGIAIDLYKRKEYKKFILVVLLASTIHVTVLVTLVILFLDKFGDSYKFYIGISILTILMLYFKVDVALINILPGFLSDKLAMYIADGNISIMAFANRFTVLLIILFYSSYEKDNKDIALFKKFYIFSFVLYLLTIKSMTISTRITLYFKVFEVILIPNIIGSLIRSFKKAKAIQLFSISMLIVFVLLIKNLNAFLDEGDYYKHVNVITYPYITLFNQADLWKYKEY